MDESIQKILEQRSGTADVLRRARALIDRPEKWCKRELMDGRGAMCIFGAINAAARGHAWKWSGNYPNYLDDTHRALASAIGYKNPGLAPHWNNAPGRTHEEVMEAFDRAIALEEGRE